MATLLVLTVAITIISVNSAPTHGENAFIENVIHALEKMVSYYKTVKMHLNLDGLFGLRVIEGQLGVLLEEYTTGNLDHVPDSVLVRLRAMKVEATKTAEEAIQFVRRDDPGYYEKLHFVVGRPWTLSYSPRKLNHSLSWDKEIYTKNKRKLSESMSDRCMSELTGVKHGNGKKCVISAQCIDMMISKGMTSYSITHQILWTMLADQAGCLHDLTVAYRQVGYPTVLDYQQEFCTNNYNEMGYTVYNILNGTILPRQQDLFLEQQFVCPNIGFLEFLTYEFLKEVLHWQRPNGCFGIMQKPSAASIQADNDYEYLEESQKDLQNDPKNAEVMEQPQQHILKKSNVVDTGHVVMQTGKSLTVKQTANKFTINQVVPNTTGIKNSTLFVRSPNKKGKNNRKQINGNILNFSDRKLGRGLLNYEKDTVFESHFQGRHLLAEKELKDGCLSHKTAVAAGALMMYLRFLLHPESADLTQNYKMLIDRFRPQNKKTTEIPGKRQATGIHLNQLKSNLGDDPGQHQAMNNNILAVQLHKNKGNADHMYSDNTDKGDDYYKNNEEYDKYPNDGLEKLHHRMVQFDNAKDEGKKAKVNENYNDKDDDYNDEDEDDDDYKEDDKENDYEEKVKKLDSKKYDKNIEVKKDDDRDYPYYDEDRRNEDYKEDKDEKMRRVVESPTNQQHWDKGIEQDVMYSHKGGDGPPSLSPSSVVFIVVVMTICLFLLMYRFIRTRRIQIKYNIRSMLNI